MKLELKQNIGINVHIAVVDTKQKWNEIKLLNGKIEIENEVKDVKFKMILKLKQNIGMSVYIAVIKTKQKQAGAELGQAQVSYKLDL